ncbi:MAG: cytidine deaminase [Sandaracinaceae bacterium]|nr:cytidine deaminase [Sandaracinaceae bacterium]
MHHQPRRGDLAARAQPRRGHRDRHARPRALRRAAHRRPRAPGVTLIDWPALERAALEVRERAYAPYSRYHVGAALLAADGTVFVGANVENASYGLCMCAERVAIGTAVTAGAKRFQAIVVATEGPAPAAPCGMCRQVLSELGPNFPVRCIAATSDDRIETDVASLLPHAFDGGYLARDD